MKTIEAVREELERRGESIAAWARKHSVSAELTRGVLLGRVKGKRGEAHKIAVLLGIKEGEIIGDGNNANA